MALNRLLLGCLLPLLAQAAPETARPDPLDPKAAVPPAVHASAFRGYTRFADEPRADWKSVNDATRRAGGWRAYAREAQAPASGARP